MTHLSPSLLALLVLLSAWRCDTEVLVSDIQLQANFKLTKYLGLWFESHWRPPYWENPDDMYIDYTEIYVMGPDGNVTATTQGRVPNRTECQPKKEKTLYVTDQPAKMYYISNDVQFDYWVLETDYISYAVAYGCDNITDSGACREPHAWGFTRSFTQSEEIRAKIRAVAVRAGVSDSTILDTPQQEKCDSTGGGASITMGIFTILTTLAVNVF